MSSRRAEDKYTALEVKRPSNDFEKLIGMDITSFTQPDSAKEYYPWCTYFFTHTIIGTVFTKLAQYPIYMMDVVSENERAKKNAEEAIRQANVREILIDAIIHYHLYGVFYLKPTRKSKKTLVCSNDDCAHETAFDNDLIKDGKALYSYNESNDIFTLKCPKCSPKKDVKHVMREREYYGGDSLTLTLYHPSTMEIQHNPLTGEEEYIYTIEAPVANAIKKTDHFMLMTTPWKLVRTILKGDRKVRLTKTALFVSKAPSHKIHGIPVPPVVRAFKNLYIRMKYLEANKQIADNMLIPMRILYPVSTKTEGRPNTKTINLGDWRAEMERQYNMWCKDPTRVMIFPIEVGHEDIWGHGKLLALNNELKNNITDILADISVPLEVVYGGATWSKQNVSSVIMQNTYKATGVEIQAIADMIATLINKGEGGSNEVRIEIKIPELVEAMGKLGYLFNMYEKGDVSLRRVHKELGIDPDDEMQNISNELPDRHKIAMQIATNQSELIVARHKAEIMVNKKMMEVQRQEQAKDMLLQAAMHKGQNLDMTKNQIEQMRIQLNMEDLAHKKHIDRSLEGEVKYMQTQEDMQRKEQEEQDQQIKNQAYEELSPEERAEYSSVSPEEQEAMLQMKIMKMQLDEFMMTLPEDEKGELEYLSQHDKYDKLTRLWESDAPQPMSDDPKVLRDVEAKEQEKREYARNVENMSRVMNELHGEELERYNQRLMVESTELYTRVRKLADYLKIKEYVDQLLGTRDPVAYKAILKEIEAERPSLLDNVYALLEVEQMLAEQAAHYARKLIDVEGTPAGDALIENINNNPSDKFKEMLFNAYSYFRTGLGEIRQDQEMDQSPPELMKVVEKQNDMVRKTTAEIMAQSMMGWDEKTRKEHLQILKEENLDMYKEVAQRLAFEPPQNNEGAIRG